MGNIHLIKTQTRNRMAPSFANKYFFLKKLDSLPQGTEWQCEFLETTGDELDHNGNKQTEHLELWRRNPVEVIAELFDNPAFKEHMRYAPEQAYTNDTASTRIVDNMWTGEWWWNLQVVVAPS